MSRVAYDGTIIRYTFDHDTTCTYPHIITYMYTTNNNTICSNVNIITNSSQTSSSYTYYRIVSTDKSASYVFCINVVPMG